MNYLKIAELANKCEVIKQKITEHYRMIGAHRTFSKEVQDTFYAVIEDMQKDLLKLETKLKGLVK